MSDRDVLTDLLKSFEQQWGEKEAVFEREIQDKKAQALMNQTTPLTREQMELVEANLRAERKSEMDQTKEQLGKNMLKDWGGDYQSAKHHLNEMENKQAKDSGQSVDNSPQQSLQNQIDQSQKVTQELRENERKKKKEQEEKQQLDQSRQQQAEQSKKDELELKRQQVREQFNKQSQQRTINQGKGQSL